MRITRKRAAGLLGAAFMALALAACTNAPNSNSTEHDAANAGINLLLANQPVPIFPESEQRTDMIEIQAMMALGSATTTFFFPEGTGVVMQNGQAHYTAPPFKVCPSEGEPIPNTASLTNPEQKVANADAVVGQMDPDGLYVPGSSSGTYVLCDQANGSQKMSYWEGPVETESGTAVWDAASSTIQDVGPSMLPVCTVVKSDGNDGTGLAAGKEYYHCVKAPGDTTRGASGVKPKATKASLAPAS